MSHGGASVHVFLIATIVAGTYATMRHLLCVSLPSVSLAG